jgi:hypothetical protein
VSHSPAYSLLLSGFLIGILIDPKLRGKMFLQNIGRPFARLHGITSQKTELLIVTTVRTSHPKSYNKTENMLFTTYTIQ